jgi:hypothetical protein
MYHHSVTLALAQARIAGLQSPAAHHEPNASPRGRHRRRPSALALGLIAIAALLPAGALAQPMQDAATPATAQAHTHHSLTATRPPITFTNPLGRSRGPGAGAGLL